nr:uncharacterized protein LOC110363633 [Columba livia]
MREPCSGEFPPLVVRFGRSAGGRSSVCPGALQVTKCPERSQLSITWSPGKSCLSNGSCPCIDSCIHVPASHPCTGIPAPATLHRICVSASLHRISASICVLHLCIDPCVSSLHCIPAPHLCIDPCLIPALHPCVTSLHLRPCTASVSPHPCTAFLLQSVCCISALIPVSHPCIDYCVTSLHLHPCTRVPALHLHIPLSHPCTASLRCISALIRVSHLCIDPRVSSLCHISALIHALHPCTHVPALHLCPCICTSASLRPHPCVHVPVLRRIPASRPRIAPCVDLRIAPASLRPIPADPRAAVRAVRAGVSTLRNRSCCSRSAAQKRLFPQRLLVLLLSPRCCSRAVSAAAFVRAVRKGRG